MYYVRPFAAVDLGLQSSESFLRLHTAYRTDFSRLDELLPADAVLLVAPAIELDAVYAPRAIVFDAADIPPGRPVFLFAVGDEEAAPPSGYTAGEAVYSNERATAVVYRTPGRTPVQLRLQVIQLIKRPPRVS
jgi:hypothetical protein